MTSVGDLSGLTKHCGRPAAALTEMRFALVAERDVPRLCALLSHHFDDIECDACQKPMDVRCTVAFLDTRGARILLTIGSAHAQAAAAITEQVAPGARQSDERFVVGEGSDLDALRDQARAVLKERMRGLLDFTLLDQQVVQRIREFDVRIFALVLVGRLNPPSSLQLNSDSEVNLDAELARVQAATWLLLRDRWLRSKAGSRLGHDLDQHVDRNAVLPGSVDIALGNIDSTSEEQDRPSSNKYIIEALRTVMHSARHPSLIDAAAKGDVAMRRSCGWGLRRVAVLTVAGLVATAAHAAEAPLVGYLAFGNPGEPTACADDLRHGLAELGIREGRDYRFIIRHAQQLESGLLAAAQSLAAEKPAVVVSGGINPMLALRAASPRTPLVTIGSGGMIETGLIASFARPGGVVTGISNGEREHSLKALELLLQAFADATRVGVVASRSNPQHTSLLKALEQLAASRRVGVVTAWVEGPGSIDPAYSQLREQGIRHAVYMPDWVPSVRQHAAAALRHGIASMGFKPNYAAVGGAMNFGVRSRQGCQRIAHHVQQVLAGRDPAYLPVEQLDDYELVINLGVLRQLGMPLAPGFVARADRVIE